MDYSRLDGPIGLIGKTWLLWSRLWWLVWFALSQAQPSVDRVVRSAWGEMASTISTLISSLEKTSLHLILYSYMEPLGVLLI